MINKDINFTRDGRVHLTTYIHDTAKQPVELTESWNSYTRPDNTWQMKRRPAVIVFPGGGFGLIAERETEPVALTFMSQGFHTFVLHYSVGKYSKYPAPVEEASKAIWEVRRHADEWDINPDAICVLGFSAGACLASMIATQWNKDGLAERLGIPEGGNKPNAAVIGYGASTKLDLSNVDENMEIGEMLINQPPQMNIVDYVDKETPPMFIWHTRYDPVVPSSNSLNLAVTLDKYKLPYELHVFERGTHGLSVNNDLSDFRASGELRTENVGTWPILCSQWLKELFL